MIAGPGQDSVRRLRPCRNFRTISTLRVVSHEKLRLRAAPATENPAPKPANHYSKVGVPAVCQTKTDFEDETTKFEIAVAGYAYRFKTYARDGVEASVKVKCFLGQPDAECTILTPALNDYLREMESCRRQVAQR